MGRLDWLIVGAYVAFALAVGMYFRRRASRNVEEFFLSGRSLPWWLAGTSMVATSFAADTPLVVTGWVRDAGIWKNWVWWCLAISGMLGVFLFARWWRRGGVMTKAELVELRYPGRDAGILRGVLGVMHAGITNTIILCWVLLAAAKIADVLFDADKAVGLAVPCAIALGYSLLAGFWGVVITDLLQFVMAMVGALALAILAWGAVEGSAGVLAAAVENPAFGADTLRFLPRPGPGGVLDASFWTTSVSALCVYLGVQWWAAENVDGSGVMVQRICAAKDERHGVLASLWYNVAHYGLRPWPWIMVALASLIVLPPVRVEASETGTVVGIEDDAIRLELDGGGGRSVPLDVEGTAQDWRALAVVSRGDEVQPGQLLAKTDSERAYVVMMQRYLPPGLLGIAFASLLAAFMSTIDTHVNLAASFFVNDVYRRFIEPDADSHHYVQVARWASVAVMLLAGLLAYQADSISDLFLFFLAFLGGVGPIYILRWLWWRVRASTEIVAMLASASATVGLTFIEYEWSLGPLSPGGQLAAEGRLVLVVCISAACALASLVVTRAPDPAQLVTFYRRVRPIGWWGPVQSLAGVEPRRGLTGIFVGVLGGLAATYGLMFGTGLWLLGRGDDAAIAAVIAAMGAGCVAWSLRDADSIHAVEDDDLGRDGAAT